jgi:K+-sensing histidine kinase KdpD
MLHELRTPVNAIQIGAEIIQQQLYGPTPHEYRALAATIAGDAARMLSAFEELERLAKLDSRAMELETGETDLAAVVQATAAQLGAHTTGRGSGFELRIDDQPLPIALARIEVERIAWRLLATLAGVSAPGEQLKLRLRRKNGAVRLDLALPAQLASRSDDEIFHAAAGSIPQVVAAGVFGVGFALRLARAEARAAGGDLVRKNERLRLTLPGLTGGLPSHTQSAA